MSIKSVALEEEQLTLAFKPEQAKPARSFETRSHYNLVVPYGETLAGKLQPLLEELAAYPELHVSKLTNCHMTVLVMEETAQIDRAQSTVAQALKDQPLQLQAKGMHVRAPGVFINVYSPDESLKNLRQKLTLATGTSFGPLDRLANIGWITLARFTDVPSDALIRYVQERRQLAFGEQPNAVPELHHSDNTMQLGKVMWSASTKP